MDNINKEVFDENFKHFIKLHEPQEQERYFSSVIAKDIETIIYNATYYYQFDELFNYNDVKQELLIHFWLQVPKIVERYMTSKKYYNLCYSICRRKFIDILRTKASKDRKYNKFLSVYFSTIAMYGSTIIDNNYIYFEEEEPNENI